MVGLRVTSHVIKHLGVTWLSPTLLLFLLFFFCGELSCLPSGTAILQWPRSLALGYVGQVQQVWTICIFIFHSCLKRQPFLFGGFLRSVAAQHRKLQAGPPPLTSFPMLYERRRSWDFTPPDVIRPFASTTLSDVAILARRMGKVWTEFKPAEGVLEAQSNDHVLSSTVVQGLGLMLSYRRLSSSRHFMLAKN